MESTTYMGDMKDQVEMVEHSGAPELLDKEIQAHMGVAAHEEFSQARNPWTILRQNPKVLVFLLIIMSTSIINGMELSTAGSMQGAQAFCKTMGAWDAASASYVIDAVHVSLWVVGATPGQFVGIFLASMISDRWGRRVNMQVSLVTLIIGAVIEIVSTNWKIWLVSKVVMGLATGLIASGAATFVAEISPREMRGGALIGFQLFNNVGNLLSAVILDVCIQKYPDPSNTSQYKIPLYVMVSCPVLIFAGTVFFLPESPTWLVMKDRSAQALRALERIYPYKSTEELEVEMAKVRFTVERELEYRAANKEVKWSECFKGTDLRRTLIAMIPMTSYVMAGNVLFLLSAYFFSLAGQTTTSLQSTVIVQCTGILFNVISVIVVENKRVGRWLSLVVGLAFQSGGMIVIGIVGSVWGNSPGSNKSGSALLVAALVISNMGCQLGPQPVGYIYTAESGSTRLRAKTAAIGQSIGAVLGQATGIYVPYMISGNSYLKWGAKTGYFFGAWGVFFLVLVVFFVPDYTGRSHAQLDELFARRIPARKFSSTECTGEFGHDDNNIDSVTA